jgi:hypothetical protein
VLGRIVGLAEGGVPLIEDGQEPELPARAARATVAITPNDVGAEVTLQFIEGDRMRPVVTGLLSPEPGARSERGVRIVADGEALKLSAGREIVLECGQASITLRRDGKLVLRGTNLLSRASGVNRIRGGTIQLN